MNQGSVLLIFLLAAATAEEIEPDCQKLNLTDGDKKNLLETSGSKFIYEATHLVQWNAARNWCANRGLQLMSPKTLTDKEGAAAELIKRGYRGYNFWLSASDVGYTPGQFHWSDGTIVDRSIWEGGQPDDFRAGKETCVYFNTDHAKLRDFSCSNTFYTLCEMPASLNSCSTA